MKKTISFIKRVLFTGVTGLFLAFTLLSCGDKESRYTAEAAAAEQSESSDCLAGKWIGSADNVEKSFTFKDDKTGEEANTPTDIRQFKWEKKDDKTIAIIYVTDPPSTQEWNLNLDCEAKTLTVFGVVFKK